MFDCTIGRSMASFFQIYLGQLLSFVKIAPRYTKDKTCSDVSAITLIDVIAHTISFVFAAFIMITLIFGLQYSTRLTNCCSLLADVTNVANI